MAEGKPACLALKNLLAQASVVLGSENPSSAMIVIGTVQNSQLISVHTECGWSIFGLIEYANQIYGTKILMAQGQWALAKIMVDSSANQLCC